MGYDLVLAKAVERERFPLLGQYFGYCPRLSPVKETQTEDVRDHSCER